VPTAEVHIVEGGHFVLDEGEIIILMQDFLKRVMAGNKLFKTLSAKQKHCPKALKLKYFCTSYAT